MTERETVAEIAEQLEQMFGDSTIGNMLTTKYDAWEKMTPKEREASHAALVAEKELREQREAERMAEYLRLNPNFKRYFFSPNEIYDELDLTECDKEFASRVHDWRNYIPNGVSERWAGLSEETKQVAYYMAQEQADREKWD